MTDLAHQPTTSELADLFDGDDLIIGRPRTTTACNALRCLCLAWADGPLIGGEPSCHICTHTKHSHQPRKAKKKAARR